MPSHPKHPAFVHFPIAFTFLTGALDAIYLASTHPSTAGLVATAVNALELELEPSTFPVLSYYTSLLTLITSAPAVISGGLELMPLIQRDGISSKKAQTGIAHALINDVVAIATAYNWWTRRSTIAHKPEALNVLISSAVAIPASFFGAYLGAQLVYQYGMGVGRSSTKAKKSQ